MHKIMAPMTVFALSLGLVTSLSPVATDMYLASMPDIASHLNVTYASVQFTLSVFLMAQGAGQLIFGPIADRFGRRRPMLIGIIVFGLSSFFAGCSDTLAMLIACRFIQGLSGALLLVVCFSSVGDSANGAAAAGIFSILMTIEGLAPIFAPIAGGFIDEFLGWRWVLWASSVMAAFALLNSVIHLGETLPPEKRISLNVRNVCLNYARIGSDINFLLPALTLSAIFFYLFAYIAGGAYLYQTIFGLSPDIFGIIFGITGSAVMVGAIVSNRLVKSISVSLVAQYAIILIVIGTCIAMFSFFFFGLIGIVAGFMVALFGLGSAEPALVSLTMESQKTALGFTAALMGALQLVIPSAATPVSGYLLPLSPLYWFLFLTASSAISFMLIIIERKRKIA